jgi:glycerol-3-phosphate dehydrogenase
MKIVHAKVGNPTGQPWEPSAEELKKVERQLKRVLKGTNTILVVTPAHVTIETCEISSDASESQARVSSACAGLAKFGITLPE